MPIKINFKKFKELKILNFVSMQFYSDGFHVFRIDLQKKQSKQNEFQFQAFDSSSLKADSKSFFETALTYDVYRYLCFTLIINMISSTCQWTYLMKIVYDLHILVYATEVMFFLFSFELH